ncbi:MAG: site-specific DNA-methyltransferase [Candidatus Omnitrophota bacterium]
MKIDKVTIDKINPAAYNPRLDLQPGDKEYEKLKKSIDTFGYVEPLVWNSRTGNLVGGHQRLKILIEHGQTEVEVSVVDLDDTKEKALNLALNKIQGDWDRDKLGHLLDELTKLEGFDTGLTGFDPGEISQALDWLVDDVEDKPEFDENATAITVSGDLIELGPHRILCGDSTKTEDIDRLLAGNKAGLLFTDPPYNVDYGGKRAGSGDNWDKIANDNMPQDKYEEMLKKVLTNAVAVLDAGACVYIWNGSRQFGLMYVMLLDLGMRVSGVITWAKETFAMGLHAYSIDYKQQTEFCLYGWKEKNGTHKWYGPENESTLWQIKRDSTINYIHPTQKPIAVATRGIRNSSKRGDIVLDLFLGSGTTLIAAGTLQRRCYGIEMDPGYCDAIVRRYVQRFGRDRVSEEIIKKYHL